MIVMTLVVRDDADVVGWNLAYHLSRGVDFVLVTSHRSSDATRDILRQYEEGGQVRVFVENEPAFAQGRWVTRMARAAFTELGAEWVLHADADEFWWPLSGDLPSTLASVPPTVGAIHVARRNALPTPDEKHHFFERMRVFTRSSVNGLGEPLPGKVCHRGAADVVVADGNHDVESPSLGATAPLDSIEVLHFPMRSYAQFEAKIAQGAAALAENRELPPRTGHVWRHLDGLRRTGELRPFYERHLLAPEGVAARPDAARYVVDDRLRRYLEAMPAGYDGTASCARH